MYKYKFKEGSRFAGFVDEMEYMKHKNFRIYSEDIMGTDRDIRYKTWMIERDELELVEDAEQLLSLYKFKDEADASIYNVQIPDAHVNLIQTYGGLVNIDLNMLDRNNKIYTMKLNNGEEYSVNIQDLEEFVENTEEDLPIENNTSESDIETVEDNNEVYSTKIIYMQNYLAEQIKSRYAMLNKESTSLSNVIVDSIFPRLINRFGLDIVRMLHNSQLSKTSVAISPFIATSLGVKQMETEQMCRILGYDKKHLKQLLVLVKNKKYDFVFVGAGGTNINTAHWLAEIAKMVNVHGLFNKVDVFEKDTIEVSNLLRFPKNILSIVENTSINKINKMQLIHDDVKILSNKKPEFGHYYIASEENNNLFYPTDIFNELGNEEHKTRDNVILYGAPDIQTRENLSLCGNFISATHASNSCYMHLNPEQDSTIQIESYGMIQLAPFFMNQLMMSIRLLEFIGQDEVDFQEKDLEILNYEFKGESKMKTDRVYNWEIQDNLRMEADNV